VLKLTTDVDKIQNSSHIVTLDYCALYKYSYLLTIICMLEYGDIVTARRYASAAFAARVSVRPSVCPYVTNW